LINFKDPSKSYNDQSGYGGGVVYNTTSDSLDFVYLSGGVRITGNMTTDPKYLLGWEKVNLYGNDAFDPYCKYRVITNSNDPTFNLPEVYYPESVGG